MTIRLDFSSAADKIGFMIQVVEGRVCEVCGKNEQWSHATVRKALCRECRTFDIWCYGCGHGNTMAFCKECNKTRT